VNPAEFTQSTAQAESSRSRSIAQQEGSAWVEKGDTVVDATIHLIARATIHVIFSIQFLILQIKFLLHTLISIVIHHVVKLLRTRLISSPWQL